MKHFSNVLRKSEKIGAALVARVIHREERDRCNCNAAAFQSSHSPFPAGGLNTSGRREEEIQWRIKGRRAWTSPLFWVKKIAEGRKAGKACKNTLPTPPPISSRSGSATETRPGKEEFWH